MSSSPLPPMTPTVSDRTASPVASVPINDKGVGGLRDADCPEGVAVYVRAALDSENPPEPLKRKKNLALYIISCETEQEKPANSIKVMVKAYSNDGGWSLLWWVRAFRARNNFIQGRRMIKKGLPTPRPLAYTEESLNSSRKGIIPRRSIILTDYLSHTEPAGRWFWREYYNKDAKGEKWQSKCRFLTDHAKLVQRIHKAGFFHADMKQNNFLMLNTADEDGTLFIADLDRTTYLGVLPVMLRRLIFMIDLRRLNNSVGGLPVSYREKLRWLDSYCEGWVKTEWGKNLLLKLLKVFYR